MRGQKRKLTGRICGHADAAQRKTDVEENDEAMSREDERDLQETCSQ